MSNQFNSDDYYTVLGIDRNSADENAIKKAYRKLAIKWHPVSHRIVSHEISLSNSYSSRYSRTKIRTTRRQQQKCLRKSARRTQSFLTRKRNKFTTSMAKKDSSRVVAAEVLVSAANLRSSRASEAEEVDAAARTSHSSRPMIYSEPSSAAETPLKTSSMMTLAA